MSDHHPDTLPCLSTNFGCSRLTGSQGPCKTNAQNKVVCFVDRSPRSPSSTLEHSYSLKFNIDGGIKMDAKKKQFDFKKLVIGVTVASLMNMSALP